jgi:hypothetical protein
LGHLLTTSGPTYPEVSSKVCHDTFCQLGNSVSLPWVLLPLMLMLVTDGVVEQTNTQSQYDRNVPSRITTTPVLGSDECKGAFHRAHDFEISHRRNCTVGPGTTAT